MDQDPKNYRDPKVTTETRHTTVSRSSGPMRWLWIALGVIVVLLLLSWLFGWMGTNDDLTDVPVEGDTVIEGSTNEVIEDAGEGAAATGNAIEGAAEETGEAVEGAAEEAGDALETETVPAEPTD